MPARASLVPHDFKTAGDQLLVYDSETGLEWLKFNVATGSLFSIESRVGAKGDLAGFSFGTEGQVQSLVSDWVSSTSMAQYQLMSLVGSTGTYYNSGQSLPGAHFYTQNSVDSVSWQGPGGTIPVIGVGYSALITPTFPSYPQTFWGSSCSQCAAEQANGDYGDGSALFRRAAEVPEPGTLPMVATALFVIAMLGRKRVRS